MVGKKALANKRNNLLVTRIVHCELASFGRWAVSLSWWLSSRCSQEASGGHFCSDPGTMPVSR